LFYLFYGRPAYRSRKGSSPNESFSLCPICFVFKPKTVSKLVHRIFPCDSGAVNFGAFAPDITKKDLRNLQLDPNIKSARKLVPLFYKTNGRYFSGQVRPSVNIPTKDTAYRWYQMLLKPGPMFGDDRKSAIEVQVKSNISLIDQLLYVILPREFLDEESIRHTIFNVWNCDPIAYPTIRGASPGKAIQGNNEIVMKPKEFVIRGIFRPRLNGVGFGIPLFKAVGTSGVYVQLTERGKITGFGRCYERISSGLGILKRFKSAVVRIGDPEIFAFVIRNCFALGEKCVLEHFLRNIASQLEKHPFVLLDIAEVLEDEEMILKAKLLADTLTLQTLSKVSMGKDKKNVVPKRKNMRLRQTVADKQDFFARLRKFLELPMERTSVTEKTNEIKSQKLLRSVSQYSTRGFFQKKHSIRTASRAKNASARVRRGMQHVSW
jgi:hypothetical protein